MAQLHSRSRLTAGLAAVAACIALVAASESPAAADPDQAVSAVRLTGGYSNLTLTLDEPASVDSVEDELAEHFDFVESSRDGDTLVLVDSTAESSPVGGKRVYADVYCDTGRHFQDLNGTFAVQRKCTSRKAPWGYQFSAAILAICTGTAHEDGLEWWLNGRRKSQMSLHDVPCGYHFHGTFTVDKGDKVRFSDRFEFRHDIGPGGDAVIRTRGNLWFRGTAPDRMETST